MIGIICAMECESKAVLKNATITQTMFRHYQKIVLGKIFNKDFVLITSGIGKVNSALATEFLIQRFNIDKILNIGLCGAINLTLNEFEIVFIEKAVQYDFDLSELNNCDIGKLEEFEDKFIKTNIPIEKMELVKKQFKICSLATADKFSSKLADINFVKNTINADCRDMEGCAIFQTAILNDIPCFSFKSISNKVDTLASDDYQKNKENALKSITNCLRTIFNII